MIEASFGAIFTAVSLMGSMILIGVLLRINQPFTAEVQQMLIKIIVNVGLPAIILSSIFNFQIDGEVGERIVAVLLFSLLLNGGLIFIHWLLLPKLNIEGGKRSEIALLSVLGNTGFIGIPLAYTLFGPEGALLVAIFDAGIDLLLWTVGVTLLQGGEGFSLRRLKALINIPMLAIIIGLTAGLTQFEAPHFFKELMQTLANIASPMAMIYIGLLIPPMWKRRRAIPFSLLLFTAGNKLLAMPIIVAITLWLLPFTPWLKGILLMSATMPSFALSSVLFSRYGADGLFSTAVVITSTLLSLLTIPVVLTLLG